MNPVRRIIGVVLLLAAFVVARADSERIFRAITASDGLADNSAQTIKCTKTGRMTITTIGNINFYDGAQFYHINTEQEEKYVLERYSAGYRLYYDANHHLWLKNWKSVTCVNLTTERFVANMDSLFKAMGMEGQVYDLFVDKNGGVWLCGEDFVWSVSLKKRFPVANADHLQDLDVYGDKHLMEIYEDGSLACYELKTGRKLYGNAPYGRERSERYYRFSQMLPHAKGFYQIRHGEEGSILLDYEADARRWTTLMETDRRLNNLAVYQDVLYVSSDEGYFTYDTRTGAVVHQPALLLRYGRRRLTTDINAIEFDRQGGMWVGTERQGLLYARPLNTPFQSLALDDPDAVRYVAMMDDLQGISEFNGKSANVMYIDSRRWTWVGTAVGLYLYKSPKEEPQLITRNDGLLNNVIHGIMEDDMHNVWVSSSYGIACLQVDGGRVRYVTSFNNDDNVPNETFVDGKVIKLDDGRIVMQAVNHVVTFNPKDFSEILSQQPIQMFPKLTSMMVNGTFVTVGTEVEGSVILDKAITRTKEINLTYDQNTVSLTFSALNYARPMQTFYRVRIKEMGDRWTTYSFYNSAGMVDRRGLFHLPLVRLRPGTYHIELQASNVIDKFVGEPYEWIVNVNEPWWRTTGVLAAMVGVLLLLLAVNFVFYIRNTRLREKRNNDESSMVRRIENFVERCTKYEQETLAPSLDELYAGTESQSAVLSPTFVQIMMTVLPYIKEQKNGFTMHSLVELSGKDVKTFYEEVSANLYKSPRMLERAIRLERARQLLETTSKSVEEIAVECRFATPNYFIAIFFHKFKKTPQEYRLTV